MPTNLYGPGDNYHPENSHVIPALICRFHEAKVSKQDNVVIWGTGTPRREFLYVEDMAEACVYVRELDKTLYDQNTEPMRSHLNVGSGQDVTIKELATTIATVTGYDGDIEWDSSKPDGPPRKLMASNRLEAMGWQAVTDLQTGLKKTYEEFLISRKAS